jgi:putative FmdB family regulatory protein
MPTYEYTCSSCGTHHEIVQSMADPTLTVCPACGEEALRKQFSGVGVVFKGSGFYRTDSRKSE